MMMMIIIIIIVGWNGWFWLCSENLHAPMMHFDF